MEVSLVIPQQKLKKIKAMTRDMCVVDPEIHSSVDRRFFIYNSMGELISSFSVHFLF
jgi:hypothetical protein